MKNPFKFLKRNRDIDPIELEKSMDLLYDLADEKKLQKAQDPMQDRGYKPKRLEPPDDIKNFDLEVTSGITYLF